MKKKKNMVKEIFIVIVLLILVLLILAVTLYDYIPSNISIAEVRKYNPDSKTTSIKQEIAYTNGGDSSADGDSEDLITSLKSYSIELSDLKSYADSKILIQGNSNPFEYVSEEEKRTTTNSNGDSTTTRDEENPNSSTESSISRNKDSNVNNDTDEENNNDTSSSNSNTLSTTNDGTTGTFFESPTSK